jgi:hypothetical protein
MSHASPLVQALSALPHGPSFRFIDELIEVQPGVSATACWQLKGDEAFLAGHFPGNPMHSLTNSSKYSRVFLPQHAGNSKVTRLF